MEAKEIFSERITNLFQKHSYKFKSELQQLCSRNEIIEDVQTTVNIIFEKCRINTEIEIDFDNDTNTIQKKKDTSSLSIKTAYEMVDVVEHKFPIKGNNELVQYFPENNFSRKIHGVNGTFDGTNLIISFPVNSKNSYWQKNVRDIISQLVNECGVYNNKLQESITNEITNLNNRINQQKLQSEKLK
jgi:hypothetical protein